MTKPLETPKELAERIGIPVTNVRYLIREDMLDHVSTRHLADAIQRFLKEHGRSTSHNSQCGPQLHQSTSRTACS